MADLANVLLTDTRRGPNISDREYDRLLKSIVDPLRSELSLRGGRRIEDAELLQVLHPSQNTVGYTFLLSNLVCDHTSDAFVISLVAYLTQFDPVQVRYTGSEFRRILELTEHIIRLTKNTALLEPLRNAILKLDPSSSIFTSNHHAYVQLCLEARRPREALPILDQDLIEFPHSDTQNVDVVMPCSDHKRSSRFITKRSGLSGEITVLSVQEYYMMGAHVYLGLRLYKRATLFLELVLATPSSGNATDLSMVEAYKKLVLVGLVAKGRAPSTSNLLDQGALRTLQHVSKAYDALAESFCNRDVLKFNAEVDVGGNMWANEGNLGLVQEVSESLRRHRVIDLQRTYASMPVTQVATLLSLSYEATHSLLQTMIAQGHVQATITTAAVNGISAGPGTQHTSSNASSVLRFHGWDEPASKPALRPAVGPDPTVEPVEGKIQAQIRRIEVLSEAVAEADRRLALTKEYNDWLRRNKRSADAGAAAFEDPMEMDGGDMPGSYADDEDIMAA